MQKKIKKSPLKLKAIVALFCLLSSHTFSGFALAVTEFQLNGSMDGVSGTSKNVKAGSVGGPPGNTLSKRQNQSTWNQVRIVVPPVNASGAKPEGVWGFRAEVERPIGSNLSRTTIIRHDLTPPKCPNISQPLLWPVGLNGEWANSATNIEFDAGVPPLCVDQITKEGTTSDAGAGCDPINSSRVEINQHGTSGNFTLVDNVGNTSSCVTPIAKIDTNGPLIVIPSTPRVSVGPPPPGSTAIPTTLNTQLEATSLSLPAEDLRQNIANPHTFRAHDGALMLNLVLDDPVTALSGSSGINFKPSGVADPVLKNLELQQAGLILNQANKVYQCQAIKEEVLLNRGDYHQSLFQSLSASYNSALWRSTINQINTEATSANKAIIKTQGNQIALKKPGNPSRATVVRSRVNDSKFDDLSEAVAWRAALGDYDYYDLEQLQENYLNKLSNLIGNINNIPAEGAKSMPEASYQKGIENYDFWIADTEVIKSPQTSNWFTLLSQIKAETTNLQANVATVKSLASASASVSEKLDLINIGLENPLANDLENFEVLLDSFESHKLAQQALKSRLDGHTALETAVASILSTADAETITSEEITKVNDLIVSRDQLEADFLSLKGDVDYPAASLGYAYSGMILSEALKSYNTHFKPNTEVFDEDRELQLALRKTLNDEHRTLKIDESNCGKELDQIKKDVKTIATQINAREEIVVGTDPEGQKITNLKIERLSPAGTEDVEAFTNVAIDTSGAPEYEWNLNKHFFDGAKRPIFSQVGLYKIGISVFDTAQNDKAEEVFYIRIYPGEVDLKMTRASLINDCDTKSILANKSDTCDFSLVLKDEYGNLIRETSAIDAYVNNQRMDLSSYFLNNNSAFVNGIRFATGSEVENRHTVSWASPEGALRDFKISSFLPTADVGKGAVPNAYILKPKTKSFGLALVHPRVDEKGRIETSRDKKIIPIKANFKPWVSLFLSDQPSNLPLSASPLDIVMRAPFNVCPFLTTQNTTKNLPSGTNNLQAFIKGHTHEGLRFYNESGFKDNSWKGYIKNFTGGVFQQGDCITTHLSSQGIVPSLTTAFTSYVSYLIDDEGITKRVTYPGGNMGNTFYDLDSESDTRIFDPVDVTPTTDIDGDGDIDEDDNPSLGGDNSVISGLIVGADIEGGFQSGKNNFVYEQSTDLGDQAFRLGKNTEKDVREIITRQGYSLIRGVDRVNPPSSGRLILNLNNLEDGGVTYITNKRKDGTTVPLSTPNPLVILSGQVGPSSSAVKHTIVVEDGNILVRGDMNYGHSLSSLGVIMLNSQTQAEPDVGNIFVKNTVSEFVGTYVSDGSILSTLSNNNPSASEIFDREASDGDLSRQLILSGSTLTRNTLGGSWLLNPESPWGSSTMAEAQKYDFHHLRRYSPTYAGTPPVQTNQNRCTKLNGLTCYQNKHAFVIKLDHRSAQTPPPGFSSLPGASFLR